MPHRTLSRANQASEHYVHTVTAALRRGFKIDDPDFAAISDREMWDKIRRDAFIAHLIRKARTSVAGPVWMFEAASDEEQDKMSAQLMTELFGHIKRFREARFNLAEAKFRGDSYAFNIGARKETRLPSDNKPRNWWLPLELKHVDRYRFRQVPDFDIGGAFTGTRWQFWSFKRQLWEELSREDRRKFTRNLHECVESSLGYGRGLLQEIYFYWWAKSVVLEQGLAGVERWAQGLLHIAIDGAREASTGRVNTDVVTEWKDEMEKHRAEHVLVHDKLDEIKVEQGPSQGHQMVIDFLNYLDGSLSQLVLSSKLPTGGGGEVGSLARAREEGEQAESVFMFDRAILSESIDAGIAKQTFELNSHVFSELFDGLGLPIGKVPKFKIINEKFEDAQTNATVIATISAAGVPLKLKEVYEKIGFTQPAEDDEVLEPKEPMAPGLPFKASRYDHDSITASSYTENERWTPEFTTVKKNGIAVAYAPCKQGETAEKTGCTPKAKLAQRDLDVLFDFTADSAAFFRNVSKKLREGVELDSREKKETEKLDKALEKLPPFEGPVFRRLTFDSDSDANDFVNQLGLNEIGDTTIFEGFSSTTKDKEIIPGANNVVDLEIESKSGRSIEEFSANPGEEEVLLPRNTKIELVNLRRGEFGALLVKLKEI